MDYRNSDMLNAINEYIRNPRYRELLRLRLCEGATYEQISEAVNYSQQHVKYICKQYTGYLISRL